MRKQWRKGPARSLGLWVLSLVAFGPVSPLWAESAAPVLEPYPPVPPTESATRAAAAPAPAVIPVAATLDRPQPLGDGNRPSDSAVRPTSLFSRDTTTTIASAPAPVYMMARPMPVGPNMEAAPMPTPVRPTPQPAPYSWQPAPQPSWSLSPGTTVVTPNPLPGNPPSSNWVAPTPNGNALAVPPNGSTVLVPPNGDGVPVPPNGNPGPGLFLGDNCGDCCLGDGCGGCCGGGCCANSCCGNSCCGGGCCGDGGNLFGCCPPGNRWWVSGEYLYWWIRGQPLPPLVTTTSDAMILPSSGALGSPGTSVLYGGNNVANGPLSGARFRGGYWFGCDHCLGLDLGVFFLGDAGSSFTANSNGSPPLFRPFNQPGFGSTREIVAIPTTASMTNPGTLGAVAGGISISTRSEFWGAEANLRTNLCCGCNYYIDLLGGYRMLNLNESLNIQENPTATIYPQTNLSSQTIYQEKYTTSNVFNGGQFGGYGEYRIGSWFVGLRALVGLGVTTETARLSGNAVTIVPGGMGSGTSNNTLFVQGSNTGSHSRDVFSVVPEVGINIGYQFTNNLRGFVGYNFLYWSSVQRPGNTINTNTSIPPASGANTGPSPAFNWNASEFWAQGLTFGLEFRY
jgi:hypothetical protein